MSKKITRRDFLKRSGVAVGGIVIAPSIVNRKFSFPDFRVPTQRSSFSAQIAGKSVYIGPYEWIENFDGLTSPSWQPPDGLDVIGQLGFRTRTQKQQLGGIGGPGLFVYDAPHPNAGVYLGSRLDDELSLAQRQGIEDELELPRGSILETRLDRVIRQLMLDLGDVATRWQPTRGSIRNGVKVHLGGYGKIINERFTRSHPAFQNAIDTYHAYYRRVRPLVDSGEMFLETLRKQTGAEMILRGFNEDEAVPAEFRSDGNLSPTTTFTDTFPEASDTDLDDHALDSGEGWTPVTGTSAGDVEVKAASDEARSVVDTLVRYRVDTDLSSDAQHGEASVESSAGTGNARVVGFSFRLETAGGEDDHWRAYVDYRNNRLRVQERIAGVTQALIINFDESNNDGFPVTWKVEVDESGNWEVFTGGTSRATATDDGQAGNVRIGLWGQNNSGTPSSEYVRWDNLTLKDLTAAAARRRFIFLN